MDKTCFAKKTVAVVAFLLAACAMAYDDVQVTYRGRVALNNSEVNGDMSMTFRLYRTKGDAEASWTLTKNNVSVKGGLFQVALGGNGLAEVLDAGNAKWIGVTIGDGKEQYPRQELLAAPRAGRAAFVPRLAVSPSVQTASVARVEAKTFTVTGRLSIGGGVKLPKDASPASMNVVATKSNYTLPLRGNVRFFSGAQPRNLGTQTSSGGGCSFGVADRNCAALFSTTGSDIMPGMTLLFKKGDTVAVPPGTGLADGTQVSCWLYAIGVD